MCRQMLLYEAVILGSYEDVMKLLMFDGRDMMSSRRVLYNMTHIAYRQATLPYAIT